MKAERPNAERKGQTDLYTVCDNPYCGKERYNGYTAPWMMFAGSVNFEWDGWHRVQDVDACSWACLAYVAARKADEAATDPSPQP